MSAVRRTVGCEDPRHRYRQRRDRHDPTPPTFAHPGQQERGELDRVEALTANASIRCTRPGGAFYLFPDISGLLSPAGPATSADFDTYLIVRSPKGSEFANDDFEGQGVSQVEFLAPEAGTWTVWASAYGPDMGGFAGLAATRGHFGEPVPDVNQRGSGRAAGPRTSLAANAR